MADEFSEFDHSPDFSEFDAPAAPVMAKHTAAPFIAEPSASATLGEGVKQGAKDLAQPFVDIGKGALAANDFAARGAFHPVDTFGDGKAGAVVREGMRGVNSNIPFANAAVEKLGGPAAESAEDEAKAPGARAFGSAAGIPVGNMVGGIAAKAVETAVPLVGRALAKIKGAAEERNVARASEGIETGAYKRNKALAQTDVVEDVVRAHPEIREAAAAGNDEKLAAATATVRAKAAADLGHIYTSAAPEIDMAVPVMKMDARIADLMKGTSEERATGRQLQKIRDEFAATAGTPARAGVAAIPGVSEVPDVFNGDGLFHTGLERIGAIDNKHGFSLATSANESMPYIPESKDGFIHRVELHPATKIADENGIRRAAKAVGNEDRYVFEMADDPKVRKQLSNEGFGAIEYEDMGPDNAYEHDTVRILDPAAARITHVARVSGGGIVPEIRPGSGVPEVPATPASGRGWTLTPKMLRAEQTAYQKKAYGKAMPGDEPASARIAANAEAQKAVGDAVFEHVTGMDYAAAKAAAEADPQSLAARLIKANDTVNATNKIDATIADRALRPQGATGIKGALARIAHHTAVPVVVGATHGPLAAMGTAVAQEALHAAPGAIRATARTVDRVLPRVAEAGENATRKIATAFADDGAATPSNPSSVGSEYRASVRHLAELARKASSIKAFVPAAVSAGFSPADARRIYMAAHPSEPIEVSEKPGVEEDDARL